MTLTGSEIQMFTCKDLCRHFKNASANISNIAESIRQFYKYCKKCELYFLVAVSQRLCDCCRCCLRSRRKITGYRRRQIENEKIMKEEQQQQQEQLLLQQQTISEQELIIGIRSDRR